MFHLKFSVILLIALDLFSELLLFGLLVGNGACFFSDFLFGFGEIGLEHLDDFLIFIFFT